MVSNIFIFIPICGRFPFWLIFSGWVETTNQITVLGGCQCYRGAPCMIIWPRPFGVACVFWNPRPFRHPLNDLCVNVAWQSDITPWFLANRSVRLVWPSIQWSHQRTSSGSNIPPNIWGTTVNEATLEIWRRFVLQNASRNLLCFEEPMVPWG